MTSHPASKNGLALKAYLLLSNFTAPLMRWQLKRRLQAGKEDPHRYRQKMGFTDQSRPAGPVIWIHGVGLGEVLALRGLILSILHKRDDVTLLVTSSTRSSAEAFCKHITPQTIHQLLPLDAKPFVKKFLDHWQPDLSVWAEQDLWPLLVCCTQQRNIPLALVNARMNQKAYQSRKRLKSLYQDLYLKFNTIVAQDELTAGHMRKLGATVSVGCSLKSVAIPLQDDVTKRCEFKNSIASRQCWLLASSHREDEQLAIAAHAELMHTQPGLLLIIAPRLLTRNTEIADQCKAFDLSVRTRSAEEQANGQVYIADTFAEMGIWYRLANAAYIGGSSGPVQGHNPWEAAVLECPIIHGPNTENFSNDYKTLHDNQAAVLVSSKDELVAALQDRNKLEHTKRQAKKLSHNQQRALEALAQQLLSLLTQTKASV